MKKQYYLPIDVPDFICHNYTTCANAILKANVGEQVRVLFASKYINCSFEKEAPNQKFEISVFDQWCTAQNFMQSQLIRVLKEEYSKEEIISIIKKCLLTDSYVWAQYNGAYFDKNTTPDAEPRDCVIVGFDDCKNEFTLYGVDILGTFSPRQVNYQVFAKALFDTHDFNISFHMWRQNKNATVILDVANLIFELEDYINSVNRRKNFSAQKSYGLKAIKELSRHFYEIAKADLNLNEAYLHKFSMHKSYMKDRIEYLVSNGIVDRAWIQQADQAFQMGKDIFALGRGFNYSHDQILIEKLVETMDGLMALETNYLPKVLEELKKYNQTK